MQFGEKMRLMRLYRHISQPALAVSADIPYPYISMVEAGKLNLKREQVERIRIALDWPMEADCILDKLGAIEYAK